MEQINYSEAYKSFLNFVRLIESDETSYTIIFEKEGNSFPVDAKFKMTEKGNYELSFSTKEVIPSEIFYNSLTVVQSEWYNIVFENMYNQQVQTKISNSGNPIEYRITTKSFRTSIEDTWENAYICGFYKYDHNIFNPDKSCVLGINHEPIEVKIQGYELTIYWGERTVPKGMGKDERFLMFFSKTRTDLLTFKKLSEAIRVTWGLISGCYIGESVYYMSCKPELGLNGLYFAYNNLQEAIVTYRGMLDYKIPDNIPEEDIHFSIIEFERLVNLLYDNDAFFRAGLLLIQANHDEGLSKGGIAAIALETITGEIENLRKKPEKGKKNEFKMPDTLLEELQDCLRRYNQDGKITVEQYEHYLKKINGFSTPFNSDKLTMPFQLLNITLSHSERDIINNRNSILHGNLPHAIRDSTFASKLDKNELVFYASNKLIMLCGMLLFGMANINKLIIDWSVTIIVKKRLIETGRYIGRGGKRYRRILDNKPEEDSPDWLL